MKPILEIKEISKKFQIQSNTKPYLSLRESLFSFLKPGKKEEFWALKNISFDVQQGDTVGIIGKNGAGKSTLLKILSKITPPTSGKIICRGRIASLLEVGTGFHPELSGRENVFMNGSILGMRRAEILKNFDAIVDFSGIEKFIDTPLKHYSSGMQLRLAFAVAAFLENEILIIDEVLAVGDAEFQKKCMGKMNDVSKSGRTILFVSHQLNSIQNLCKSSLLLNRGELVKNDVTSKVVSEYLNSSNSSFKPDSVKNEKKKAFINSFEIHSDKNFIQPQQPCSFKIQVSSKEDLSSINIGIGINDSFGVRLFTLFTKHFDISFNLKKGLNDYICKLDSLPLKPGIYYVYIYLGSNYETLDYVDEQVSFEVMETDFGFKEIPDSSQGSILINQIWKS